MWWAVYIALCGVLIALSRGGYRAALLLILCGLLAVQTWKVAPVGDLIWLCFAASWIAVAIAISAVSDANRRHVVTISALTLISATCYPVGRFGGFAFAPGSPVYVSPLFWADMALVSAIILAGGPGIARFIGHIRDTFVGWLAGRGGRRPVGVAWSALGPQKKAGQ